MDKLIKKTFNDIKSLKVQGATAGAKTMGKSLADYGQRIKKQKVGEWQKELKKAADYLLSARPTDPMSQNVVKFIFSNLKKIQPQNVIQAKNYLKKFVNDFLLIAASGEDLIVSFGEKIIKNKENIFTHCHSSLVEKILEKAQSQEKKFEVFNTETRPLFQGRITARELLKAKIPTTMVADSSAGFLISRYSGQELMMDKIILGADAIMQDGSVVNKIGSFTIALVAHQEKVPLYIATSLLKYHSHPQSLIKIEKRPPQEIWAQAPSGLKIINFAFDKIPPQYISGIICEAGIIKPKQIKEVTKKIYPFLN
jgi:ribose 1,5-bisphosphate isomerase